MAKKPVAKKRGPGKPTTFNQKIFNVILTKMAEGISLAEICRGKGMPPASTVRGWVALDKPPGVSAIYARARDLQLEAWADEIIEIIDDGRNDWMTRDIRGRQVQMVNREVTERSKLRMEGRKWLLAKLARGKYGEQKETKSEDEGAVKIEGGLPPE